MTVQITAADTSSSIVTGQGGQSLITGNPSTGSSAVIPLTPVCQYYPNETPQPVYSSFSAVISGTWVGQLQVEGSADGGNTYSPYPAQLLGLDTVLSLITGNCTIKGNAAGLTNIRIRASQWTSGTANILFQVFANEDFNNVNVANPVSITGAVSVTPQSCVPYTNPAGITNTPVQLKAGAGTVSAFDFVNKSNADAYIQFFDALAVNVTLGSTPNLFSVWVPQSGGFDRDLTKPYQFNTGITIAATTAPNNGAAPSSNIIVSSIGVS